MADRATDHDGVSRRTMMTGVVVAGTAVPLLAACADASAPASETGAADPTSSDAGSSSPADTPSPAGENSEGAGALASTAEVAVGGALFLEEPSVVITQPTAGEFRAFERACTHQGCPVTDVRDGKIHCNCHGSLFSLTDGAPEPGSAATQPLVPVEITVEGDQIVPA